MNAIRAVARNFDLVASIGLHVRLDERRAPRGAPDSLWDWAGKGGVTDYRAVALMAAPTKTYATTQMRLKTAGKQWLTVGMDYEEKWTSTMRTGGQKTEAINITQTFASVHDRMNR
jgi:hypothetical protein